MKFASAVALLAIVLFLPGTAPAQTRTTDAGGRLLRTGAAGPLPAVAVPVTLNSRQFGRSTRVYTGSDGWYYFHNIPLGVYTLEVWVEQNRPLAFPIQLSTVPFTHVPDKYISRPTVRGYRPSSPDDRLMVAVHFVR